MLVSETSRLFGLGADYRKQLCSSCFLGSVSGLIGYRYLKLSDDLQISSVQNGVIIPATFAVIDQFNTRNHFNGVNLGLTGVAPYGAWRFEWLAKVALGATTTDLNINGATTTTAGGVTATAAGGLLALSSNIGRYSDSRFSTVSEFSTRVAYQLSPQWKGYVGYDVMYWTGVVQARRRNRYCCQFQPDFRPLLLAGPPVPRFNLARQTFGRRELALG